jgi:hypothetical protein
MDFFTIPTMTLRLVAVHIENCVLIEPVELERISRYVACDMFETIFSLFDSTRPSEPSCTPRGDTGPPSSAPGPSTFEAFSQSTIRRRRSNPLGLALAALEWLAICSCDRQARNSDCLASARHTTNGQPL